MNCIDLHDIWSHIRRGEAIVATISESRMTKFKYVKHARGIFDPELLSGSLYSTIPILTSMTYVLGSFLYDDQNSPVITIAWITFVPIAIGVVLAVFNALRRLLANRQLPGDTIDGSWNHDSSLADNERRLQCHGDKVEIARLRDALRSDQRNIAVTPYTRLLFLAILFLLCSVGWIAHLKFSVSKDVIATIFYVVVGTSILWRFLFPFRYEVQDGRLIVRGVGLVSKHFRYSGDVILQGAAIDCRFQDGLITVRPKNGEPVEISLDGISRKHALVAALFAAAKECTEE